jgi:uncharacterized membrane protein
MEQDKPPLPPIFQAPPIVKRLSAGQRLRTYFLTGLVVAGPLAITAYITWSFVKWVDGLVKPLIPHSILPDLFFSLDVPGLGLVVALIGLTLLGFLTANLVGRSLLDLSETVLGRMPVIRGLYKSMKQIFMTVFNEEGSSFRKVGMVEYPAKGMWSLVFISTPPEGAVAKGLNAAGFAGVDDYISCFLPCTPNPTTGFYFYLPKSAVIELDMSTEDAAKLIMSAGMIQPDELAPSPMQIDAPTQAKA